MLFVLVTNPREQFRSAFVVDATCEDEAINLFVSAYRDQFIAQAIISMIFEHGHNQLLTSWAAQERSDNDNWQQEFVGNHMDDIKSFLMSLSTNYLYIERISNVI
jgi:hypothetical protein